MAALFTARVPLPGTASATVNGKRVAIASSGDVVAIPPAVGIGIAGFRMGKAYRIENVSGGDKVEISYRWRERSNVSLGERTADTRFCTL